MDVSEWLRTTVKRVLPAPVVEYARAVRHRRSFKSEISRETRTQRFIRRAFTHKKPSLFHLDVHVTDHCNLNCRGCDHYSSISDPHFADINQTARELERLAELFEDIQRIYLLGGEPLLHPQVDDFVRETRRIFPSAKLCVMTNGLLVTRMPGSFWDTLREQSAVLLCDNYPIRIDHDEIDELGRSHGVTVEWVKPIEEFFKIPIDVSAGSNPKRSFDMCRGLANCAIVRDGRLYPCAHIAFADIPIKRFGVEGIVPGEGDSLAIFDDVTGEQALDFLTHAVPWCAHCDFGSFKMSEWGRSKGEADEWFKIDEAEKAG